MSMVKGVIAQRLSMFVEMFGQNIFRIFHVSLEKLAKSLKTLAIVFKTIINNC